MIFLECTIYLANYSALYTTWQYIYINLNFNVELCTEEYRIKRQSTLNKSNEISIKVKIDINVLS